MTKEKFELLINLLKQSEDIFNDLYEQEKSDGFVNKETYLATSEFRDLIQKCQSYAGAFYGKCEAEAVRGSSAE